VPVRLLAHHDLDGAGDGMQVLREGDATYVGHFGISGMGTSILDVSDPSLPRLVEQWPAPAGTHTHKLQVADGLLLVNEEQFRGGAGHRAGMVVYELEDPLHPKQLGRLVTGGLGVHRIVWTGGRYAHASATPEGFADRIWIVSDLDDPEHPVEAARWWLDEPQPPGKRYAAHHALLDDAVAYLGYGDAGLVVLDVSEMTKPRQLARLDWDGGDTHTCLPLPDGGSSSSPTSRWSTAPPWSGSSELSTSPIRRHRASSASARPRRDDSASFASGRTTCTRTVPAAT
jgi:hypothetical protein